MNDKTEKLIADELCRLTNEAHEVHKALTAGSAAITTGIGWLKSHSGLATKQDLVEMEKRLIDAIGNNSAITPSIATAALANQSALDKLDATIPDRKTE